jgi:signal transduction histidine kinase
MDHLSDQALLATLQQRLEVNRKALNDLQGATRQLEATNLKLQESEALKSDFLSNIRNEINNPLAAILGLAKQLATGGLNQQRQLSAAQMIYAEAYHLDFQLQNIFIAAELEAGEAAPSYSRVELQPLVTGIIDALAPAADRKKIEIEVHLDPDLIFVTDAQKLQVLLLNLLDNAIEFGEQGSQVALTLTVAPTGLNAVVTDTGPGIDPSDQKVIFDRFRQLDRGSTKRHRGHGLGLSICRSLVELLGGEIGIQSVPGAGCEVCFLLPVPDVEADIVAHDANLFLFDESEIF